MLAFLDAEFNCGVSYPEHQKDSSLLEVAMTIVSDIQTAEPVAQYQSYCRPKLNHGLIYPIIRGMTHIKQKDIDAAPRFPQVFEELKQLLLQYGITEIYVWGNFDRHGFIWNCSRYPEITDGQLLTDKITDITKQCISRIGLTNPLSLKDIAFICDCMTEKQHNAVDDTKMLADVIYNVYNGHFDKDKVTAYSNYVQQRDAYFALRKAVNKVKQADGDLQAFLKMADHNQGFPNFIYQNTK